MARLYTCGAEIEATSPAGSAGFAPPDGLSNGVPTRDTTTKRSGAASFKCDSAASAAVYKIFSGTGFPGYFSTASTTISCRAYLNFTNLPDATVKVMQFTPDYSARITSAGKLQLWNDFTAAQIGSDSAATIATGTWYRVEMQVIQNASPQITDVALRLDGTTVASASGLIRTAGTGSVFVGWVSTGAGTNKVLYVDDFGINDSTGSANTSWLGDGKVVLLVPISDNARATLWTGGAGGTTNLWDAVNNTPPVGLVSASATNTSQIEHGGGAAGTTDAYDANMKTYTTAGIVSGDTVNAVSMAYSHGEDIATGSKLLNFEVLSNPVIASPGNETAGLDAGAVGTYPTNWVNRSPNSVTVQAPSVTLGTSPVMRVRRPETATRVASVCFMGMYVDYTPAVVGKAPPLDNRRRRSITRTRV